MISLTKILKEMYLKADITANEVYKLFKEIWNNNYFSKDLFNLRLKYKWDQKQISTWEWIKNLSQSQLKELYTDLNIIRNRTLNEIRVKAFSTLRAKVDSMEIGGEVTVLEPEYKIQFTTDPEQGLWPTGNISKDNMVDFEFLSADDEDIEINRKAVKEWQEFLKRKRIPYKFEDFTEQHTTFSHISDELSFSIHIPLENFEFINKNINEIRIRAKKLHVKRFSRLEGAYIIDGDFYPHMGGGYLGYFRNSELRFGQVNKSKKFIIEDLCQKEGIPYHSEYGKSEYNDEGTYYICIPDQYIEIKNNDINEIKIYPAGKLICSKNNDEDGRFRLKVTDPRFAQCGYLSLALTKNKEEYYFMETYDLEKYFSEVVGLLQGESIQYNSIDEKYQYITLPKDSIQIK